MLVARVLSVMGFALAVFLAAVALGVLPGDDLPGCGISRWVSCDGVLNDLRYSQVFGTLPVAVLASVVYVALMASLIVLSLRTSVGRWMAVTSVTMIGLAAVWFITIQIGVIGKICPYCMAEHIIGLILVGVVYAAVGRSSDGIPQSAMLGGVVGIVVLISGQLFVGPVYQAPFLLHDDGGITETAEPGRAVVLANGYVQLNRDWHLYIGPEEPDHVIVEIVDYNCPHCLELHEMTDEVLGMIDKSIGILVLTYPLNDVCNPYSGPPYAGFETSCDIAVLAHAVNMIDRSKFSDMHDWLFENQRDFTMDEALDFASTLVDRQQLIELIGGERPALEAVRADIDRAHRLFPERLQLPRIVSGNTDISLPPNSQILSEAISSSLIDQGPTGDTE